jgi:hypothetical protein
LIFYYYLFYIFYELNIALKRNSPELFANLFLSTLILINFIVLNHYSGKMFQTSLKLNHILIIGILLIIVLVNQMLLIGNGKYLMFEERFRSLKGLKKKILNIGALVYIILSM